MEKKEIASYFEELNIAVDDNILDKCLELCISYNIEAEDFCDQWYAFTASNLNGAAPTVEYLEKMERKEFHKNKEHSFSKIKHEIHDIKNPTELENAALTPQSKKKENPALTPVTNTPISQSFAENDSFSVNSSEKFLQRTDSRSVLRYYGSATASFKREDGIILSVKEVEEYKIPKNIKYMFEIMGKKARRLNDTMYNLSHDILDKNGLILSEGVLINQMGEMVTYGRIVSDADGKINAQSILLEGSDESNLNYTTHLNISKLTSYSLFPGQVVVAKGNNVKNYAFVADSIYTKADLELPEEPPITTRSVQVVVAAGPFTLSENLSYEPLHDLLQYVREYKPHILILTGPFLDETHKSIQTGDLTQTFDSFFEDLILNIMDTVQHLDIHVVIVPSHKEIHHHPVYPTPPYHIKENYNKLTFVSDPGVIEVDGLRIMTTTADILMHMSGFELYYDKESVIKSGRLERMASHILHQKNIYPLYPSHEDLCIDHVLLTQFGTLHNKPHILILPSNLKCFIKDIEDCLVINPERLTTGFQAGTFARIEIEPGNTKSICSRVSVQVLKI